MQHRARDAITFFILLANDRSRRRLLRPDIQRQHSEEKIKNDAGQHLCVWIRRADTMWHMRQSHFAASGLKLDAIGNDNDTVDARRHCLCRCAARNRIVRGSLGCLYAECAQTLSRLQCLIHRNRIILHEAISQTNEATLFQMRRQHRQSYTQFHAGHSFILSLSGHTTRKLKQYFHVSFCFAAVVCICSEVSAGQTNEKYNEIVHKPMGNAINRMVCCQKTTEYDRIRNVVR